MNFSGKPYAIVIIALLFPTFSFGQNIVYNGSFELHDKKTTAPDGIWDVTGWKSPTQGTPDCFYKGGNISYGVPSNFAGKQQPHSGDCYAGIICYGDKPVYREYIETKLIKPLIKDSLYRVVFYVSVGNKDICAINRMGAYLSNKFVHDSTIGVLFMRPQIESDTTKILDDDKNWTEISGLYKATGGEQYLTIGNFYSNSRTRVLKPFKTGGLFAYYYIDDVSVTETGDSFTLNKSYILRNVYFDPDKADFMPSSYPSMDTLVGVLNKNPAMQIEIGGYTDTVGNEIYNQHLSETRALAVMDYLIKKGINAARLTYKGYGNKYPIASNETDAGRQQNRRVEFKVIKLNN